MAEKKRLKYDCMLIGGLLLAALLVFLGFRFFRTGGSQVKVEIGGECVGTYSLRENAEETFTLPDGSYNVLSIRNGAAFVSAADCRDQICVHHREIRNAGETIICLPHKLVVTVEE